MSKAQLDKFISVISNDPAVLRGIVQTGNYEELIAQEGPFADPTKRQIA